MMRRMIPASYALVLGVLLVLVAIGYALVLTFWPWLVCECAA